MAIAAFPRRNTGMSGDVAGHPADVADELFEMANLFPRTTGLPVTIWVSPSGGARHDALVKVFLTPGKMDVTNTAVVGLRPRLRLLEGDSSSADFAAVAKWLTVYEAALIEFRNEMIDSVEFGSRLQRPGTDG
jgi:hypothetical protein